MMTGRMCPPWSGIMDEYIEISDPEETGWRLGGPKQGEPKPIMQGNSIQNIEKSAV